MSNVKERILGAVTVMSDADAEKVWNLIQGTFTLENAEIVEPDADEVEAMDAYKAGNSDYQHYMTQDELKTLLGV